MGKVIDKIKSWFKRKPRLEERYTLNRKYLGRSERHSERIKAKFLCSNKTKCYICKGK